MAMTVLNLPSQILSKILNRLFWTELKCSLQESHFQKARRYGHLYFYYQQDKIPVVVTWTNLYKIQNNNKYLGPKWNESEKIKENTANICRIKKKFFLLSIGVNEPQITELYWTNITFFHRNFFFTCLEICKVSLFHFDWSTAKCMFPETWITGIMDRFTNGHCKVSDTSRTSVNWRCFINGKVSRYSI